MTASRGIYPIGDSKTIGTSTDDPPGRGYPQYLCDALHDVTGQYWIESPTRYAVSGAVVADIKAGIDAQLAAVPSYVQPVAVWINLGTNDVQEFPLVEATWKSDYAYILDALHTKFPSALVYNTICWRRSYGDECDTLASWQAAVLADGRSAWALAGDDERVWMENGDDGETYTDDGVHPNHVGYLLAAAQKKTVMGY